MKKQKVSEQIYSKFSVLQDLCVRINGRDPHGEVSVNCANMEMLLGLAAVTLENTLNKNLTYAELDSQVTYALRRLNLPSGLWCLEGAKTGRLRCDRPNYNNPPRGAEVDHTATCPGCDYDGQCLGRCLKR